jgi:hypothetical protein
LILKPLGSLIHHLGLNEMTGILHDTQSEQHPRCLVRIRDIIRPPTPASITMLQSIEALNAGFDQRLKAPAFPDHRPQFLSAVATTAFGKRLIVCSTQP